MNCLLVRPPALGLSSVILFMVTLLPLRTSNTEVRPSVTAAWLIASDSVVVDGSASAPKRLLLTSKVAARVVGIVTDIASANAILDGVTKHYLSSQKSPV